MTVFKNTKNALILLFVGCCLSSTGSGQSKKNISRTRIQELAISEFKNQKFVLDRVCKGLSQGCALEVSVVGGTSSMPLFEIPQLILLNGKIDRTKDEKGRDYFVFNKGTAKIKMESNDYPDSVILHATEFSWEVGKSLLFLETEFLVAEEGLSASEYFVIGQVENGLKVVWEKSSSDISFELLKSESLLNNVHVIVEKDSRSGKDIIAISAKLVPESSEKTHAQKPVFRYLKWDDKKKSVYMAKSK